MEYLKAEQLSTAKWRVLAIPFGGPLKDGRDTDREFFSTRTDIKPHWFDKRPVIFHHGKDATVKDMDLGIEDDLEEKIDGWWASMWLDKQNRYFTVLETLMRQGKAFGSSGPIAHLVKKDYKTGEILVWPHAEQTITLTPANIFSQVAAAKAAYDFLDPDLGRDLPSGGDDSATELAKARAYSEAVLALHK